MWHVTKFQLISLLTCQKMTNEKICKQYLYLFCYHLYCCTCLLRWCLGRSLQTECIYILKHITLQKFGIVYRRLFHIRAEHFICNSFLDVSLILSFFFTPFVVKEDITRAGLLLSFCPAVRATAKPWVNRFGNSSLAW